MKMMMAIALALGFSVSGYAHDEGHGPKMSENGKYGGIVAPVVKKADASKGPDATAVHKAELTRAADGTVHLYLYDQTMKPLDLKGFDKTASATISAKGKGDAKKFTLELKDKSFVGKMPKPDANLYNVEIALKKDGTDLISAYQNLGME